MGTSILLSFGLVIAIAVIAVSAFIVYATVVRIVRDRMARRAQRLGDGSATRGAGDGRSR
jgi:hypothetical protein